MLTTRRSGSLYWAVLLLAALVPSLVPAAPTQPRTEDYGDVRASHATGTRTLDTRSVMQGPKLPGGAVRILSHDLGETQSVRVLNQKCPQVHLEQLPAHITGPE